MAAAAPAIAAPRLFEGSLEVRSQQGDGCEAGQAVPYRIAVHAFADDDHSRLLVWGDMAPASVRTDSQGAHQPIQFLGQAGSSGGVELRWKDGAAQGAWSEAVPSGPGCAFTEARLQLDPLADAAAGSAREVGGFLDRMFTADDAFRAAGSPQALKSATDAIRALVGQLPPPSDADGGIAETLLLAGHFALAQRPREQALPIFAAASTLYRRNVDRMPDATALGLLQEARAQRRVAGAPAGEPLLREALAILERSGHADGPAASSALGLQGAWRLAAGNAEEAATSFARAADIDERRGAPATERVISLGNLGAAMLKAGRTSSALQVLRRALAICESAPDVPRSLVDGVRSTIDELQGSGSLT